MSPGSEGGPQAPRHETRTLGELAAAFLRRHGVEVVFGIPGTHNLELYRGLAREGIRHVLTRHEQGACYAADGYARATGKPGVVIATSGPGITNCITGIANAYADAVPLLVFSPGPARGEERRDLGFLHEAKDQRAGIEAFAEESIRVEDATALRDAVYGTFARWGVGRRRPVHIELPTDAIGDTYEVDVEEAWSSVPAVAAAGTIHLAADAIARSRRPLLVAGGGAVDAAEEVTAFATEFGVPLVTTLAGKGVVNEHDALNGGAVAGSSSPAQILADADCIIACGTELKNAGHVAAEATIVRFDVDAGRLHRHRAAHVPVLGDVALTLPAVAERLRDAGGARIDPGWADRAVAAARGHVAGAVERWAGIHRAIVAGAGPNVVLTGDSSQISYIGTVSVPLFDAPRRFLSTDAYATLGYALPAAIGASCARPGTPVVAVVGDGAFMFSVQELATARTDTRGLPVLVYDNAGYAEIRQNMADAGIEPYAVDLPRPDYAALAQAFGCAYDRADDASAVEAAVRVALAREEPTIVHVRAEVYSD